jgi:hypothetical protein
LFEEDSLGEIQGMEGELFRRLGETSPGEVVSLLSSPLPALWGDSVVGFVDRARGDDPGAWEEAFQKAIERAKGDPCEVKGFIAFAEARIHDLRRRGELSQMIVRGKLGENWLLQAAQFAAGSPAAAEIRQLAWSLVPSDDAIEGLGFLCTPAEAGRFEALGSKPAVLAALQTAWSRSGAPAFKEAALRLGVPLDRTPEPDIDD